MGTARSSCRRSCVEPDVPGMEPGPSTPRSPRKGSEDAPLLIQSLPRGSLWKFLETKNNQNSVPSPGGAGSRLPTRCPHQQDGDACTSPAHGSQSPAPAAGLGLKSKTHQSAESTIRFLIREHLLGSAAGPRQSACRDLQSLQSTLMPPLCHLGTASRSPPPQPAVTLPRTARCHTHPRGRAQLRALQPPPAAPCSHLVTTHQETRASLSPGTSLGTGRAHTHPKSLLQHTIKDHHPTARPAPRSATRSRRIPKAARGRGSRAAPLPAVPSPSPYSLVLGVKEGWRVAPCVTAGGGGGMLGGVDLGCVLTSAGESGMVAARFAAGSAGTGRAR